VLNAMQRLYTREEYMRRIAWMKTARRPIAITTDIIVGFPGETEADFEATLGLLDEVEYDSIFSFKYSRRPNTSALALEGQVPEEEKSRRLMILQERQRDPGAAKRGLRGYGRGMPGGRIQPRHRAVDRANLAEQDPQLPAARRGGG
jgi:tRNA A37 methylthiotransferase MiaB